MCALLRLSLNDLPPGAPLPCAVFDKDGRQLFPAGIVIGSVGYSQFLLARGLYRQVDDASATSGATSSPPRRR